MQLSSQSTKICSRCKAPAPLEAPLCEECGQVYQSQYSADTAPPLTYVPVTAPAKRGNYVFMGVIITLLAITSLLFAYKRSADDRSELMAGQVTHPKSGLPQQGAMPMGPGSAPAARNAQFYRP